MSLLKGHNNQCRLALLVLASLIGVARADSGEPTYSIACRLEADRAPSLTGPLQTVARQQIQQVFEAVLGPEQRVRFLNDDEAGGLPSFQQVEQESVARQWSGEERLILVRVHRSGSSYVVQAREFDPRFQVLSAIFELRTLQRELVPDCVGRAVLQVFSPLAEVRSATGTNVQVEFLGGGRLHNYRSWLGLAGNAGLQVMREPVAAARNGAPREGTVRPTRYRRTFLALRSWDGDRAECELIGPDKLFQDLGSGTARYLARPVRGGTSSSRIQVVRRDGGQPQRDCEVFVSPEKYSTEPNLLRGLTDHTGMLRVDLTRGGIQFVSVRYEDLVMKAPLLPGASSDPMIFEVPTRGRRAEFIRPLRQVIQEIDDQFLVDVRLTEELKAKAEAKDAAEVRKLIERGKRKRLSAGEVDQRVREVELRARNEGEDVSDAAAQVRETAAKKISKQMDQTLQAFNEWADRFEKKATLDDLTNRINELQDQMEWQALVPLFEQLVKADPDPRQKHAEKLHLLKKGLETKTPEHAAARAFMDDKLKEITARDLANRWGEIERSARTLLVAKDHLTLLKLRRAMNTWARELGQEVKGLVDQIEAAAQDENRAQELRARLDSLNDLNATLQKLYREVQAFLESKKV